MPEFGMMGEGGIGIVVHYDEDMYTGTLLRELPLPLQNYDKVYETIRINYFLIRTDGVRQLWANRGEKIGTLDSPYILCQMSHDGRRLREIRIRRFRNFNFLDQEFISNILNIQHEASTKQDIPNRRKTYVNISKGIKF